MNKDEYIIIIVVACTYRSSNTNINDCIYAFVYNLLILLNYQKQYLVAFQPALPFIKDVSKKLSYRGQKSAQRRKNTPTQ